MNPTVQIQTIKYEQPVDDIVTVTLINRGLLDNNTSDYGWFHCRYRVGVGDSEFTPVETVAAVDVAQRESVSVSHVVEIGNPRYEAGSPDPWGRGSSPWYACWNAASCLTVKRVKILV